MHRKRSGHCRWRRMLRRHLGGLHRQIEKIIPQQLTKSTSEAFKENLYGYKREERKRTRDRSPEESSSDRIAAEMAVCAGENAREGEGLDTSP
jgi:hypothetical protein